MALGLLGTGCASVPNIVAPMHQIEHLTLAPAADRARIVIVRPSAYYGSDVLVEVLEAKDGVLGYLANKAALAVDVTPGKHSLCAVALTGATWVPGALGSGVYSAGGSYMGVMTDANLEAGKTYMLKVDIVASWTHGASANLLAVRASSPEWSSMLEDLPSLRAVDRDGALGSPNDMVMSACSAFRDEADAGLKNETTLSVGDGGTPR